MKNLARTLVLALGLLPTIAAAIPPSYVTGLEAEYQMVDGEPNIHLTWQEPQSNEEIAFYRIYYSIESILENNGLYDDFEETEDNSLEYDLTEFPDVDILYLAIIGVNTLGEDADLFVEEIAVILSEDAQPISQTVEEYRPPVDEEPENSVLTVEEETLLIPEEEEQVTEPEPLPSTQELFPEQAPAFLSIKGIEALSPSEISVEFTATISVEPSLAPQAFSITNAFGETLPIQQMVIEGSTAIVTTAAQQRGVVYEFSVTEPAYNPDGLPLDPQGITAYFEGHPQGIASGVSQNVDPAEQSYGPLQGITNLELRRTKQSDGRYTVNAAWDVVGDPSQLGYYLVRQTRNDGNSFSEPQQLTSNISGLQLNDVEPGPFGLSIEPVDLAGNVLSGVFDTVTLEGTTSTVPPPVQEPIDTGTVEPMPNGGHLGDSGPGAIALAVSTLGGIAGWAYSRRRKLV